MNGFDEKMHEVYLQKAAEKNTNIKYKKAARWNVYWPT